MITAAELAARLERLPMEETQRAALQAAAERLAGNVREALGGVPGDAHAAPWERSGQLRASIGVSVEAVRAVIGSSDPVAIYQETGTARVPPRPFLAPAAASVGESLARDVGAAIVELLR